MTDWADDESAVFLDSRIHEEVRHEVQERCREPGVLDLKGIGRRQYWAIPALPFTRQRCGSKGRASLGPSRWPS